jgi:N-acetylglucosamine kinase-like BadF-type ATPase
VEIGRGLGGASNHHSIGLDQARRGIEEAIESALQAAENPTVSAACWGMAGLDWPEDERLINQLARQLFPTIPIEVVHDSTIALVGGTDGKTSGVVIISIVVGYHPSGRIERASGWGHLLGDEGSGHFIALQGLTAATRARDGRDRETSLVQDFVDETGEESFESLANRIYLEDWSAPDIAALAPVVINAADQEDQVALAIIDRAANELALGAKVVIQKLGLQGDTFDVVLSGGIFKGTQRMVEGIREQILAFAPNTSVHLPIREPLIGAGMIAMQLLSG